MSKRSPIREREIAYRHQANAWFKTGIISEVRFQLFDNPAKPCVFGVAGHDRAGVLCFLGAVRTEDALFDLVLSLADFAW